jgi:DNA-directed RNA polymerase specialized sigma24 family protein
MQNNYEKMGLFYIGKNSDGSGTTLYKSKDLTTHAMIIGMTGSGKTGLGISLIEEASIDNIPSIIIDPKGDMGNLCLAFKDLDPKKFQPWVKDEQEAQKISKLYKDGLEGTFQDVSRVNRFAQVQKTIYTPGSSAGVGVNVLGNFNAPPQEVLDDADTLSSLINTTVSSLLSLISIEADPITSKEHLLLSNIFYYYYSRGISLTLEDIIGYVVSPPFKKVGMLQLKTFYEQNQRMKLAMTLNGIISSVSFSSWIEGEDLDIQNMLYDENGKAKVAIFSISHLDENQRMFFVTILLNAYINWMRKQKGSNTLKSLLYMDEIFGFFPPLKNPPSKEPMLVLLKQARAFGVGVVLSTQNPVDLDYKGLSNIGTWFVGKLQTKQDISKVLKPLMAKSKLTKEQISNKLMTLKGRHFFMKNVHADETIEFSTRWVLSYLKGPMTKDDIRKLMKSKQKSTTQKSEKKEIKQKRKTDKKPILNQDIKEYFLNTDINSKEPFYPYIYADITLRFYNQKRAIDRVKKECLSLELDTHQNRVDWEQSTDTECEDFTQNHIMDASYSELPTFITELKSLKTIQKSLSNHLYSTKKLQLFSCTKLKLESKPEQSKRDFIVDIEDRLKELRDQELEKLKKSTDSKLKKLNTKLKKLEIKLEKEKDDVSSKTTETIIDIGLTVLGAFFGKKSLSATTLRRGASAFKKGKHAMDERGDVDNVQTLIQDVQNDIEILNTTLEKETQKIDEKLHVDNYEITPFFIKPRRSDVTINEIAILWKK